jgi:hypothetical protein
VALNWHRRCGKDSTCFNYTIRKAYEEPGIYYYFFETFAHGRRILWDGINKEGKKFLEYVPDEIIESKNETDMKIKLKAQAGKSTGSIFQIIGTDNCDSVVGTNVIGAVFSEYALQNPRAWDLVRPILRENGGWAIFVSTPRGHNHFYELKEMAKENPLWWYQELTVRDTKREDGSPVISEEMIEEDRKEGMSEDLIQQEYYCSFEGSLEGNYYGELLAQAEAKGRILDFEWDPRIPVDVASDLGYRDPTALWFIQRVRNEHRFIDYFESNGEAIEFYVKLLQEKPYVYGEIMLPHDANITSLQTGKDVVGILRDLGVRNTKTAPRVDPQIWIQNTRSLLPLCWFHKTRCKKGLAALRDFHKEYDEERKEFKSNYYHDWTSHAASALATYAMLVEGPDEFEEEDEARFVTRGRNIMTGY